MAGSKWKNRFNWEKIKDDISKEKESKTKSYNDDRMFKPDWKAAIAQKKFYTLRFLPDQEGNPFAHYYNHAFQYAASDGSGKKWYINNCISTFGWDPKCPICNKNSEYYESAYESDKKLAKERGRKQNWISNILVVNDPINPENNGKVFLFRYGFKIYQKIENQMFPSDTDLDDEDFEEFTPFDIFNGADFKLKIRDAQISKNVVPNYDDSAFSKPKPVFKGDEDLIDAMMESVHSLDEFTDPKNFPTIDETIKRVGHLLGVTPVADDEEEETDEEPTNEEPNESTEGDQEADKDSGKTEEASAEPDKVDDKEDESGSAEDDDEAFFANLQKQ